MRILLLTLFYSYSLFAQDCRLPQTRLPVFDQDGLGTCASNTAALMMRYNIGGVDKVPSYLQLAVGASASVSTEFFKANSDPRPQMNRPEVLFLESNQICTVVKNGMEHGFCDSENFPLDFLGKDDVYRSQQKSLDALGKILSRNQPQMQELRRQLANPATKQDALARLGQLLYADDRVCSEEPKRAMAIKLSLRRKQAWTALMNNTADPAKKAALKSLLARTFKPDGQPTEQFINFLFESMFPPGFERSLSFDETQEDRQPDKINGLQYSESVIGVHWGYKMNIESPNFVGATRSDVNDIRRDWLAVSQCKKPKIIRAFDNYFKDPNCPIDGTPVPQNITDFLEKLSTELVSASYDPQNALISIISPSCAYQSRSRIVTGMNCGMMNTRNENESQLARAKAVEELCSGRVFGVSVCSGFLEAESPYNSNYCKNLRPGTPGNAYHAMTVISKRPSGDKTQFLVQNSWGKSCKFANGEILKPGYVGTVECERGSDGVATGRFWIDEDLLFKNTNSVSILNPTK